MQIVYLFTNFNVLINSLEELIKGYNSRNVRQTGTFLLISK